MRKPLPALVPLLLAGALAGCASLTASGVLTAASLDPLTTDPARLTAGVGLDEALHLRSGDVVLRLAYAPAAQPEAAIAEEFRLEIKADDSGPAGAAGVVAEPGERIHLARIAAVDLDRARSTQQRITALKQTSEGRGELTISVVGGCLARPLPAQMRLRTFLRTTPAGPFVRMTETADVLALLPPRDAASLRQRLTACPPERR
ncbi:hypothetical protein [Pannonibacter tanglangensis]|uniref:Lipoprotein n=1 Tax=Pannonibacter tanglangensis TaxID=2750084 RepID=A0ABW9ZGI3_9HYPH|nr:hypothetical protein [Pannonibacter sp. XCT-34]NBN63965.1 hypothetical protein [Pannonibacter sp. XCT-34]